jgi:protocatechuate 3,4-dioxygenase, beta subunit
MRGNDLPELILLRRKVIHGSLALAGTCWLTGSPPSAAATLPPTPQQTAGPFYPLSLPQDSDNDLIHVSGRAEPAKGIVTQITSRILDPNGQPVSGARVEIWQCDANGRYPYVKDGGGGRPRDENFQGYGTATTDATGGYQFQTVKPVPYPGRTPHIHFAISGRGFERFVTQMYVAGEPTNAADPVLMGVRDPAARNRLVVELHPVQGNDAAALTGKFDIVLGPS